MIEIMNAAVIVEEIEVSHPHAVVQHNGILCQENSLKEMLALAGPPKEVHCRQALFKVLKSPQQTHGLVKVS